VECRAWVTVDHRVHGTVMFSSMPFLRHHFDRPVLAVKPPVM